MRTHCENCIKNTSKKYTISVINFGKSIKPKVKTKMKFTENSGHRMKYG